MTFQELRSATKTLHKIEVNRRAIEVLSTDYEGFGMPVGLDSQGREDAIRLLLAQQRRHGEELRKLGVDVTEADLEVTLG